MQRVVPELPRHPGSRSATGPLVGFHPCQLQWAPALACESAPRLARHRAGRRSRRPLLRFVGSIRLAPAWERPLRVALACTRVNLRLTAQVAALCRTVQRSPRLGFPMVLPEARRFSRKPRLRAGSDLVRSGDARSPTRGRRSPNAVQSPRRKARGKMPRIQPRLLRRIIPCQTSPSAPAGRLAQRRVAANSPDQQQIVNSITHGAGDRPL